jgi:hypothetical protein
VVNPYIVIAMQLSIVMAVKTRYCVSPTSTNWTANMKKIVLAAMASVSMLAAVAPAYAYDHHHHPVCHKVRVHHHWEKRCH